MTNYNLNQSNLCNRFGSNNFGMFHHMNQYRNHDYMYLRNCQYNYFDSRQYMKCNLPYMYHSIHFRILMIWMFLYMLSYILYRSCPYMWYNRKNMKIL